MPTAEQWAATWRALAAAPPEGVYEALMARYAEPHRHYHTQRHLAECFAQLADVRGQADRIGEVELALWFHDAIYDTKRHDNEQRSAEWARQVVIRAGLDPVVGERVATLVMATRHPVSPRAAQDCARLSRAPADLSNERDARVTRAGRAREPRALAAPARRRQSRILSNPVSCRGACRSRARSGRRRYQKEPSAGGRPETGFA